MSVFEVDENDLSIILDRYEDLYLKELTYYGTSDANKMLLLINYGHEISGLENKIINDYYKKYIEILKKDINAPELYYLQKIIYCVLSIMITMVSLYFTKKTDSDEFKFKNAYLIGLIENFIEKIINPISFNQNTIILKNKIFTLDYPVNNLKKFINQNKHKFMKKENTNLLEQFIKLL